MAIAVSMPEVCYAAKAPLSGAVRRLLLKRWLIKEVPVSEVVKGETFPEFLWLHLGRVSKTATSISLIKTIAGLQTAADQHPFVFISGNVSKKTHEQLAEVIYKTFPDPLRVQVDLAGEPDYLSALEKFRAIRERAGAPTTRLVEVPNADLRSESGRLSARLISQVFGVTLVDLAEWTGRTKQAISKTPDAESLQAPLQEFARVALFRKAVGGDVAFRQWLQTRHAGLEGKSPLDWIKAGRVREVADYVEDALSGQPT
jgi:hypothetical protein